LITVVVFTAVMPFLLSDQYPSSTEGKSCLVIYAMFW